MSADPLSYTATIMIPGRPGKLSERLLTCKNPPHSFLWSPGRKHVTEMVTFSKGMYNEWDSIVAMLTQPKMSLVNPKLFNLPKLYNSR